MNKDLKKYAFLHFTVIGLLSVSIIVRLYPVFIAFLENKTIGLANQMPYFIGIIILAVILFEIIKRPSTGYMIITIWLFNSVYNIISSGLSGLDFKNTLNAYSVIVAFGISLFIWWKVYGFDPFNKFFQKNKLPKN